MLMKRLMVVLLALAGLCDNADAQSYFTSTEIGISGGGSQYFGDLNDRYGFKTINWAAGVYVRKHFTQYISIKAGGYYTKVGYTDKLNQDLFEKTRNLDFTSKIYEFSVQAEFNFFRFTTGDPYHRFTPYLTGGIGAFMFDPYTFYNGNKYMLRPMGTEGQFLGGFDERKYNNIAPCIPIGAGVKFWLKGGVNLTLEVADRLTLTDYLDDVSTTYVGLDRFPKSAQNPTYLLQDRSTENLGTAPLGRKGKQRGNSATKDQYLVGMISMSWHFVTYRCPSFMDHDMISTY